MLFLKILFMRTRLQSLGLHNNLTSIEITLEKRDIKNEKNSYNWWCFTRKN